MRCQLCGKETLEQGLYCFSCGNRLNKECPRCAEIIRLKAKICRFCGYEFTADEMAQIEKLEQEITLRIADAVECEKQEREKRERQGAINGMIPVEWVNVKSIKGTPNPIIVPSIVRTKVPGGWLIFAHILLTYESGLTFYPDPNHEWN